ncbi:hypothetical protein [Rhodopseudomonas sp.]|uniref:hypothetical protein n=1 Tax=Rhodopseudomonas sp. TaxID=1078 RepID=UPI0025FAC4DA|nr:hypothetical protein [Rhodopseudomonas sp.]
MIGITLNSEQIRQAPQEVRQWIEREVIASLGLQIQPAAEPQSEHLASCSADEVAAILAQIQGVLPAVNVFFEFGRAGLAVPQAQLAAFRLLDIAHHTRLQDAKQVIACINMINEALGRVRGDPRASFCGFDREGHCFVAVETQLNIRRLWQSVIAAPSPGPGPEAEATVPGLGAATTPAAPSVVSGPVGAHLGNSLERSDSGAQP